MEAAAHRQAFALALLVMAAEGISITNTFPRPGGSGFSVPGGPLMAAGAAVGYGAWLESEFEDQAARMILTGQMNSRCQND